MAFIFVPFSLTYGWKLTMTSDAKGCCFFSLCISKDLTICFLSRHSWYLHNLAKKLNFIGHIGGLWFFIFLHEFPGTFSKGAAFNTHIIAATIITKNYLFSLDNWAQLGGIIFFKLQVFLKQVISNWYISFYNRNLCTHHFFWNFKI